METWKRYGVCKLTSGKCQEITQFNVSENVREKSYQGKLFIVNLVYGATRVLSSIVVWASG